MNFQFQIRYSALDYI